MKMKIPDTMRQLYSSPGRFELASRFADGEPTLNDLQLTHKFIKALACTIGANKKVVLRGLGTFEWKPWSGSTPTVENGKSWRLTFKFTRSERKKHKEITNG